jgi:hypothetical protein
MEPTLEQVQQQVQDLTRRVDDLEKRLATVEEPRRWSFGFRREVYEVVSRELSNRMART